MSHIQILLIFILRGNLATRRNDKKRNFKHIANGKFWTDWLPVALYFSKPRIFVLIFPHGASGQWVYIKKQVPFLCSYRYYCILLSVYTNLLPDGLHDPGRGLVQLLQNVLQVIHLLQHQRPQGKGEVIIE